MEENMNETQQNTQTYQQPYQQPYQAPVADQNVSLGDWMLTMLLMVIPIVNIVMVFVWAFGSNSKPSKKNWARATLIWMLIGIVVGIVFGSALVALVMNAMYY